MGKAALITGISTGLGKGFAEEYLGRGYQVYGISRRGADFAHERLHERRADLAILEAIPSVLDELLADAAIDVAILNAGILGEIKPMSEIAVAELRHAMNVNVWSNKTILDWFINRRPPKQAVLISSGAAVIGHRGWGSYALSKAALNMLAQLYAHELPDTHIVALAPGRVHTAMQDYIFENVDEVRFPSAKSLKQARGTPEMPEPRIAARNIVDAVESLPQRVDSGAFIDIRRL